MIQDKDGVKPDLQRLHYAAKVLEDSKKLADYNVQNLQVVHLFARSIGGMMASDSDVV